MLDVRRLRALHALADRGTIAAAADVLDLTPSAVSQQLAALERETGRRLVEPEGRTVRLTPAGRLLVDHAEALFAQLERLDADLAAQDAPGGVVRVGAFASGLRGLVVPAIADLAVAAPGVRVEAMELEAADAFDRLGRRDLDVVVSMESAGAPRHDDPRLYRRDLLVDVLDVALPAAHPLAGRPAVDLAALRDDPWVMPLPGSTCDEVILAGCRAAGFSPRSAHATGDWSAVIALVAAGAGVALVARLADPPVPAEVALRPLDPEGPHRHIFGACRRGAEDAPAVRATFDALARVAEAAVARPVAAPLAA